MNSADSTKKRKVECPDDTAQLTAADEGSMVDIIAQMRSEMNDMKSSHLLSKSRIDELENKCEVLETKCSSLERSIGILTKESKWEYSVSDIHRGYWIDKGYSDDYADDMEELIEEIKSLCSQLRSGKYTSFITLGGHENGLLLDNDNDVLLPHWEEFANALQLYQSTDVSEVFSIDAIQLTPSIMDLLTPALMGKLIKCISFDNNELDDNVREGIEFAVESIRSIQGLTEFNWSSNHISSERDAQYLVDSVISHPSIDAIQFTDCFRDLCGYKILCQLLASGNYKQIIFNHNFRGTGGRTEISDYIATNPPLDKLILSGNQLNDDDIQLIVRSLKHNTNLRHLRLEHNNITEVGKAALIKLVYDTTSLNSMADCNHTCCIDSISYGDMPNPNLSMESPEKKRARKIYHLLSERNKELSNIQHLNSEFDDEEEDSMKLVPKILESIHSYSPPPIILESIHSYSPPPIW